VVRIDRVRELDAHLGVATQAFLRRLRVGHLYAEQVAPTLAGGDSDLFVAVRDRPWPPWGVRARTIAALCQTHPVGAHSVGVSPIYVAEDDATNIGLIAALYKEVLDELARRPDVELTYPVIEGSVLADRTLRRCGFSPSEDLLATPTHRYLFYRAEPAKLRATLGLDRTSTPELLAHEIDDKVFDGLASYFAILHLASQPTATDRINPEIIWIDGGLFDASLPGGVGPVGPPGPSAFNDITTRNQRFGAEAADGQA
jgi:hypothetical protein